MNRKGVAFIPLVVLILFIASIVAVVYYKNNSLERNLEYGLPQREILETYVDGESARQYIARAAKYSAHQAVYNLLQNGGYEDVVCEQGTYWQCTASAYNKEIDNFACSEEFSDSRCEGYNINNCEESPCVQSEQAILACVQEDGLNCKLLRNGITLKSFGCVDENSEDCAIFGAEEGELEVGIKVVCEQVTEDKECQTSACGNIGQYAYWYNSGSCFPSTDKINAVFDVLFTDGFEDALAEYDKVSFGEYDFTLYDIVDLSIKIDHLNGLIEGVPKSYTYSDYTEDEDGNIVGEEILQEESYLLFYKKVVDPKGLQPTVEFEYSVNPYFKITVPAMPEGILSSVRSRANMILGTIASCGDNIEKCASDAQSAESGDKDFTWKITGEVVEEMKVVKFEATPLGQTIFGVDGTSLDFSNLAPVKFAVKFSGGAPVI